MSANLTWPLTMHANQQVLETLHYQTLVTSVEPVESNEFNGTYVIITAIGADHFVAFNSAADESGAIVPAGSTLTFGVNHTNDPVTVSVRTVSGSGRVSIYPGF